MPRRQPPIGTWPAGSEGNTVTIGAAVPRTGAYAVQGEDELKGRQLAVEHINDGHRPDQEDRAQGDQGRARQAGEAGRRRLRPPSRTRRCRSSRPSSTRTRSSLMTGSTSSAVAVALNKFAQREKILYRRRHLRLERHHRQGLRALRLPPVLLRRDRGQRDRPGAGEDLRQGQEGGVHDAGLHLRPHRHEVGERLSDQERRLDAW